MTNPIYSIEAGSPQTTISAAYTYGDASLSVVNSAVLPAAPNILSISYSSTSYITMKYELVVGNVISVLTLIDGDDAFEFPAGSRVARVWSKYDHDAFSDHISDLEEEKVDKAFGVSDSVIITDGSGVISSDAIKTAFNSDIATEVPLMDGVADVGDSLKLAKEDHVHPTDTTRAPLDVATTSTNGLMSSEDWTKLDGIAAGSQVNVLEGIQIDGVDVAITSKKSNIPLATSLLDGAMSSEDKALLDAHLDDTTNPHDVTKDQVGLSAVDNTSDADKPISTAQQSAIGALAADIAANDTAISTLNGDLEAHQLDTDNPHQTTLEQLGAAPLDHANRHKGGGADPIDVATITVDGLMSSEDKVILDGHVANITTNPHNVTKTQVGLGNCDNTSDVDKPVSTAQATAIGLKAPTSHASTATTYGVSSDTKYGHAMASSTTPLVAGIAAVGSEDTKFARGDHVHPTDTSRASLDVATITDDGLMSSEDKVILDGHIIDIDNPHSTTATQVGLGNCDNTSDADKPVSTAQATAIGLKVSIAQGESEKNKILVTNVTTGDIETLAKKTAFNSDIATETPLVAGTPSVGVSAKLAKEDHVHPAQTSVSGNSGTATKLATARTIDGVNFDGSAAISRYGVCATIAKTAAKAVTITGYTLVSGAVSVVKFTNGNVANSPTLNITSTGAKPITRKGVAISPEKIEVGGTYVFVYDGTNYEIIGSYIDNSPITVHGMIIDETNSDPVACISYIGASAGLDLAARKAVFESTHPFVVVKAAEELFTVDTNDWSKKLDGTDSGVTTDGLSLDGNFMIRYPTFWFRIQTLGTDIHSVEWTHDNPGSGNGWVCCHLRGGTIRDKIWVGVTKGVVSGGNLRAIYSDTELPTVSLTSEQFYTAAQATGTADGVTGENPYTITQPLVYMMRCILKYWTYGTLNLQTDVARGLVDDTDSVIGRRPVCVGVSPTSGYTQGTPASSQAYTDNASAVVCGEIDPYGNVWEHMIDIAYRFGEIAFATDSADHFDVGTLTLSPDNWDSAIPATWQKITGVGTTAGYIRKMLWATQFPFVSKSTVDGSARTYWSDYTYRKADDTAENKVPRCCISGGAWADASRAGPAYLSLSYAVGYSCGYIGARLQIFSKE